jgi:hypothetical protein
MKTTMAMDVYRYVPSMIEIKIAASAQPSPGTDPSVFALIRVR